MNAESEISSGKQHGTGTGAFPFHLRVTALFDLLLLSMEAVKITSVNILIHWDFVYHLSKALLKTPSPYIPQSTVVKNYFILQLKNKTFLNQKEKKEPFQIMTHQSSSNSFIGKRLCRKTLFQDFIETEYQHTRHSQNSTT